MSRKIFLDTGVIMLNFVSEPIEKIKNIFSQIHKKEAKAFILEPALEEIAFHLCVNYGKEKVETYIASFIYDYDIQCIKPEIQLIQKAGILKCQYRSILSYFDALIIEFSLKNKLEFHTTEKKLRKKFPAKIVNKLKIITYRYD